jgi:hypothetical protein
MPNGSKSFIDWIKILSALGGGAGIFAIYKMFRDLLAERLIPAEPFFLLGVFLLTAVVAITVSRWREPPDLTGEWNYRCTTRDFEHGGVCEFSIERTKVGYRCRRAGNSGSLHPRVLQGF